MLLSDVKSSLSNSTHLLFFAYVALAVVCCVLALQVDFRVNTDLTYLLPENEDRLASRQIQDHMIKHNGHQQIAVVEAENYEDAELAVEDLIVRLESNPRYAVKNLDKEAEKYESFVKALSQYRFYLLSEEDRKLLDLKDYAQILGRAKQDIYQPGTGPRWVPLSKDPLNLFNRYILQGIPEVGGEPAGKYLVIEKDQRVYMVSIIENTQNSFDLSSHDLFLSDFSDLESQLESKYSGVNVYFSGLDFHVAEASAQARREVSIIATGSLIVVVLLFVFSFRSIKPLIFGLLSILSGVLFASSATVYLFGQIHLLTFVFGASLIGVSIDYALHHVILLGTLGDEAKRRALGSSVKASSFLGLISTVIAYSLLFQSDLPGLKQIAFFSVIGLLASWMFVILGFRLVVGVENTLISIRSSAIPYLALMPRRMWSLIGRSGSLSIMLTVILGSILLITLVGKTLLDVGGLHKPLPQLIQNDLAVQSVIEGISPNQYFIVTAEDVDSLIEAQSELISLLDDLIKQKSLSGYESLSQYFPSTFRQLENFQLQKKVFGGPDSLSRQVFDGSGLATDHMQELEEAYNFSKNQPIASDRILDLSHRYFPHIWVDRNESVVRSVVYLKGIRSKEDLKSVIDVKDRWVFVDRVDDLNTAIHTQFSDASWLLMFSVPIIFMLLVVWHKSLTAGVILLIPLSSILCTLSLLSLSGASIGLFHVFGLYLVLGLGLDYAIFLYRATEPFDNTLITVLLSSATSCASFGFLALSSTPMVSAFGVTIVLGSIFNVLLVPLLLYFRSTNATT